MRPTINKFQKETQPVLNERKQVDKKIEYNMCPWHMTKAVISNTGIFVAIANQHIVWVKIIDFSFMPKIIRILSKDHVPWRYFVNFLP